MNDESDCDFDLDTRINVCESESDDHRDDDDVGTDGDNDVDHAPARLHRKKLKLVHGIYKTKYSKEWPVVSSVSNDPYQFWCNTCSKKLSCAHQGKADIIWSQGFLDFLVGRPAINKEVVIMILRILFDESF